METSQSNSATSRRSGRKLLDPPGEVGYKKPKQIPQISSSSGKVRKQLESVDNDAINASTNETAINDDENTDEIFREDGQGVYKASVGSLLLDETVEDEFLVHESEFSESVEEEEREEEITSECVNDSKSVDGKLKKYPFKLKNDVNGNILTVHNTVTEQGKLLRIRLATCCFSERGTQLVVADKRGNVFVFDLVTKFYWKLPLVALKVSVIIPVPKKYKQYVIGTKLGQLFHFDIDRNCLINSCSMNDGPIYEISFAGSQKPQGISNNTCLLLLRVNDRALIFDLKNFKITHRLENDDVNITLKFTHYLPFSEQIFSCFSNDCVHIWSSISLNTLRFFYPIKARDRKLRLLGNKPKIPIFSFKSLGNDEEFFIKCYDRDYSDGMIISYNCSSDGRQICFSTIDGYLMLLSAYTFEFDGIYRLNDFILQQCVFLSPSKGTIILGVTTAGHILLLDLQNIAFKVIIKSTSALDANISNDGKLLAVLNKSGEVDVWSTCRLHNAFKSEEQCFNLLREARSQYKPVKLGAVCASSKANECFNENLKKLLKRDRLLNILKEYGCYPAKYRFLIWCSLLNLPNNRKEFQILLKMPTPPLVKENSIKLKLKNEVSLCALIKIWSCLAHWCKVFAYSNFLTGLIFPFVKIFSKNLLVCFEVCATLLLNQFQLWFEFHPLQPRNYLGMCENVMQYFDNELCNFYSEMQIQSIHYAWSILSNGFSEIFDETQWLCLWDNIISCPPYFPIFITVAYNMNQREIILRLTDKLSIAQFFHEQNAVDICKIISKAHCLMNKCPSSLHPMRYIKNFQSIPKNCYPKFSKYPQKWVSQQEKDVASLQLENKKIDDRIRELEFEEFKMLERLEKGLREEEFAKRMKEMEKTYQEALKNEEERVACQRKLLLLYQKEMRNRKGEVMAALQESERRKKALLMEGDLNTLKYSIERERLRNDTKMVMAEEEIRNQDMELLMQRYFTNTNILPVSQKYQEDIKRICGARKMLHHEFQDLAMPIELNQKTNKIKPVKITDIEQQINEIHKEFMCLTTSI